MNRFIFPVIAFLISIPIPAFSVLVENPSTAAGSGSGDVVAPAANTDLYVPQWNGTDSKTLKDGFPITTQGKTLIAKTSTADMVTYLGASSGGLTGTSGYVPKFTSSSTAGNSAFYQSGTNIGLGTTTPQRKLSVVGDAQVTGNAYITGLLSGATGTFSGTVTANAFIGTYQSITISVDGGGATPATGALAATYHAPINMSLSDYYMSADVTGSAVIDIKRNGVSIVGAGNKPTLSSNVKSTAALASWTSTTITAGDRLTFNLDSCTTCTAVTVILKGRRQ